MPFLLLALAGEIAFFAIVAPNFFTAGNFFEVVRLSVELGLLAIALTPIIITGGIDLSVGSMMGLAAVIFGAAIRDWHLPPLAAGALSLGVGLAGGGVNALLVARLGVPPLIVTLGTFSLFRGIAEGLTQASVNYTGFPRAGSSSVRAISAASFPHSCRCSSWCSPPTRCSCIDRSIGRGSTRSASRRRARDTPASPSGGGSGSSTCWQV